MQNHRLRLELWGNPLGDEGDIALLQSEYLPSLRALDLRGNELHGTGSKRLHNLAQRRSIALEV